MAEDNNLEDLVGDIATSDMPKTARKAPLVGRPPLFDNAEELQAKIDKYFDEEIQPKPMRDEKGDIMYTGEPMRTAGGRLKKDKDGEILIDPETRRPIMSHPKPPTVAGLAIYLGFKDYRNIYQNAYKNQPEFNYAIKGALARIAQFAQEQLFTGQTTGAIFWLKNHGWADKVESEVYGKDGGAIETKDVSDKDRGILKHFINNYKERVK